MKKLNSFIDTSPYWVVFFVGLIFAGSMSYLLFGLLQPNTMASTRLLYFHLFFGGLFGGLFCLMISMMRASKKFWEAAAKLNDKLAEVKTKEELEVLIPDFRAVKKLSGGGVHTFEVNRLYTKMETMHPLLHNAKND